MLTLSYEYGKVTPTMKIRLSVMVEDEKDFALKKGNKIKVVDRSKFMGVEYFRVAPHPFITIDISGTKDKNEDSRNPNLRVNVNRMYKHILTGKIKKLISCYTESESLFYYDSSDKLKTEKQEALKYLQEIRLSNGSTIRLAPAVVYKDPENPNSACEGAFFMINTPDNYCTLTLDELIGFYDMLVGINMDSMAMELLLLYEKSTKDDTDTEDPPTIVVSPTFPTKKALYEEEKPKEPEAHSTPAQVQKSIPNFE